MGSSDCDADNSSGECPQRRVAIQSFEMGQYEVTFDEYAAFVLDTDEVELPHDEVELPHDEDWGRGSRPVINVSWNDAKRYIEWLNEKVRGKDKDFRLPTEAEWEYAARAGTITVFSFGDDISKLNEHAWFYGNSEGKTHPVGQKKTNPKDLFDMHGNVWEWVEDDWHENYKGAWDDGRAWVDDPRGAYRVVRGGSWRSGARYCRSAHRRRNGPGLRGNGVGFRLSRSVALGP